VSTASDAIDLVGSIFGAAAKAVPVVAAWLKPAVDADPNHPLSKRVSDILTEGGKSRAVLNELEKD